MLAPARKAAAILRGEYVFELGAGKFVAMTYEDDGRTQPFENGDGAEVDKGDKVAWDVVADTAIRHGQSQPSRRRKLSRSGSVNDQLVMFDYGYVDDASIDDKGKVQTFFKNGTCTPSCPPLATFKFQDSNFAVGAVAATLDALVEPPGP